MKLEKYLMLGEELCKKFVKDYDVYVRTGRGTAAGVRLDAYDDIVQLDLFLQFEDCYKEVKEALPRDKYEKLKNVCIPKNSFVGTMEVFALLHEIGHIIDAIQSDDRWLRDLKYEHEVDNIHCKYWSKPRTKKVIKKMCKNYRKVTAESVADDFAIRWLNDKNTMNYIKYKILEIDNMEVW